MRVEVSLCGRALKGVIEIAIVLFSLSLQCHCLASAFCVFCVLATIDIQVQGQKDEVSVFAPKTHTKKCSIDQPTLYERCFSEQFIDEG
ncbi:unnamed protein product [Arctia plantaginis]|uniref:Uncharacterized protein n=1 Tax=Arctia plantaginis TaxID=874455 RepID=A0A8S1BRH3_ARCPL|nr:unnamed protein product [Arctia plantaginis]